MTINSVSGQLNAAAFIAWQEVTANQITEYYSNSNQVSGLNVTIIPGKIEQTDSEYVYVIHFSLVIRYEYSSISVTDIVESPFSSQESKQSYQTEMEKMGFDIELEGLVYATPFIVKSGSTKAPSSMYAESDRNHGGSNYAAAATESSAMKLSSGVLTLIVCIVGSAFLLSA